MTEVATSIPVVQYIRPNGRKQHGALEVPTEFQTAELKAKLDQLAAHGITITQEDIGLNQVNVCLDDGNFDYKIEIFPYDENYGKKVMRLVLDFDEQDYLKVSKAYEDGEDMFGGPNG